MELLCTPADQQRAHQIQAKLQEEIAGCILLDAGKFSHDYGYPKYYGDAHEQERSAPYGLEVCFWVFHNFNARF
jgi:hypothetical protein